jgi:hypothetical protein
MWLIGVGGASLIAVTVSAQIYLSMLTHGHSFVRIVAWQWCSWSVWAVATPSVLRLGARVSERSIRSLASSLVGTGVLIISAHILVASLSTVGFQPYRPMETFALRRSLVMHTLSMPADVAVYAVLLLIGSSLAVSHRARSLAIRESGLEADPLVPNSMLCAWRSSRTFCSTHSIRSRR